MKEMVLILGDTHGEWDRLINIFNSRDLRNCTIIHVGDVGLGFVNSERQLEILNLVNTVLSKRNIKMYAIRGNHDDPAYFKGEHNYSNLLLLPDYSTLELNGERWLFVGGAISVDRIKRTPYKSWWPDEDLVYDVDRVTKCDVLVTHTAPNWIGPTDKNGIAYYTEHDDALWDECTAERLVMNRLVETCGAKRHYCGHFHMSTSAENNGCRSTILDINELLEHR